MRKLFHWLDLGMFLRGPAYMASGFAVLGLLGGIALTGLPSGGVAGGGASVAGFVGETATELAGIDRAAAMPVSLATKTIHEIDRERRCLAMAIYHEARGESLWGQRAVLEVVRTRVDDPRYPATICDVVYQGAHRSTGCQFSFTCDGASDRPREAKQWAKALRLANLELMGKNEERLVADATHYHADYVDPYWASSLVKVRQIGRHIFYRSPGSTS